MEIVGIDRAAIERDAQVLIAEIRAMLEPFREAGGKVNQEITVTLSGFHVACILVALDVVQMVQGYE